MRATCTKFFLKVLHVQMKMIIVDDDFSSPNTIQPTISLIITSFYLIYQGGVLSDNYQNQFQSNTVVPAQKIVDLVGFEPTTSAHQQQLSKQGPCMHLLLPNPEHFCRAEVEIVPLLSIDHHTRCCTELGCSRRLIHHLLPSIKKGFVLR